MTRDRGLKMSVKSLSMIVRRRILMRNSIQIIISLHFFHLNASYMLFSRPHLLHTVTSLKIYIWCNFDLSKYLSTHILMGLFSVFHIFNPDVLNVSYNPSFLQ